MGLMNWLGIGDAISKPIDSVSNLYTTDKARIEAETKLQDVMQKPVLAQQKINEVLASSSNFFNSAWQPLIGWSAGFLILMYWGPQLVLANYLWYLKCISINDIAPFPIKPDDIMNLVYLVFGFGGYTLIKKKID
jgi:hypothetical protein